MLKRGKYIVSNYNSNLEKQVILLMIPNGEKRKAKSKGRWHYRAVKKLPPLLKGITSKHHGGFIDWIAFIPLQLNQNLNCIKNYVKIKIFVI